MKGRKANDRSGEGASSEIDKSPDFCRAHHSDVIPARDASLFEFGEGTYSQHVQTTTLENRQDFTKCISEQGATQLETLPPFIQANLRDRFIS